ncbi:nicotinate-nucleotide adenylyltransferase [Telmatospirillum sp. J64-1]|uniref:nicotinate-nucleotide adenylyltransferase n=1 Tax=Telmatospirillum sp. J64-1 TaxID=2502183 RepID=UPI00115D17AC|nr:nicotinate-nucleotide adenylyltransferase [Telmatospirillum sp. J64-1]
MKPALPPSPWGDSRRLRVGLLGGSFNPAHDGHRYISEMALKRLGLDEIWWLVSPQNPLKARTGMASLETRLDQARRVAAHPRIRISGMEKALGTRYTADTLAKLRQRFPFVRFVWLIGDDNLAQFPRWKNWHDIFSGVGIAVFARGQYSFSVLAGKAAKRYARARIEAARAPAVAVKPPPVWVYLPIRRHPASATQIRAGLPGRDWSVRQFKEP